jgi:hypothetical protein
MSFNSYIVCKANHILQCSQDVFSGFQGPSPPVKGASPYDAEIFALTRTSSKIQCYILDHPTISTVCIYSDCSSALMTIFNSKPHASQTASILFRTRTLKMFSSHPNLNVHLVWTPGHTGVIGNKITDKLAKKGARLEGDLLDFHSKLELVEDHNLLLKRCWRTMWEKQRDCLSNSSRFYLASTVLCTRTKPTKKKGLP